MVGLAGFGMHPALLGSHPGSYGDMGLAPGMGHMGMPGAQRPSARACPPLQCGGRPLRPRSPAAPAPTAAASRRTLPTAAGMPGGLGGMNGLLAGGGLGPGGLGHMGLPSGLVGGKPLGLGSHDGGSSDNLLASDSGARGAGGPA